MIKKISEEKTLTHWLYYDPSNDFFHSLFPNYQLISAKPDGNDYDEKIKFGYNIVAEIYHCNEFYEVLFPSEEKEGKKEKTAFDKLFSYIFPFPFKDDKRKTFELINRECKKNRYLFCDENHWSDKDKKFRNKYKLYIYINIAGNGRIDPIQDTKLIIYKFPDAASFNECKEFIGLNY
jgi:hypothetical protein